MKCLYPIGDYPVYRFSMPIINSNMYLVLVENSCLAVDPCISDAAEELLHDTHIQECLILLTHEHYDHISGVNWLRGQLPCQVVCSENCAERIRDSKKNYAAYFEAMFVQRDKTERKILKKFLNSQYTCQADQTYSAKTEIHWKDLVFTLRETPGHSPGSQVIEIGKRWYFTGDYLIPGEKVITRLPGGNRRAYAEITRPYLESIAPGSILFPGHGEEIVFDGQLEI